MVSLFCYTIASQEVVLKKVTCEKLAKLLFKLHRLFKDFSGLLVCLSLIHFPVKHITQSGYYTYMDAGTYS